MYSVAATCGMAKRATLLTAHGAIQTPVFMNVATQAAIKGGLDSADLAECGCQVALCNTYHLHLRPGEGAVARMGGLRRFMAWEGPVLTDSGGFQVHSLSSMRKITEEGVFFSSHIDGRKVFMGPEESMEIQAALGATVAMAFDECAPYPCDRGYMRESAARTARWLLRCKARMDKIGTGAGGGQLLFGINQGGVHLDIRAEHAARITETQLDGWALGGLAVGEPPEAMYGVLEHTVPLLPRNAPTYLMGVGTPANILEAVERGVDFFDCVMPARNGRHGHAFTSAGVVNLKNARHERADIPIDRECPCRVCRTYCRAYIRHLFKAREALAMRLVVMHNLSFYNGLMARIRAGIEDGSFARLKGGLLERIAGPEPL